MIETHSLRLRPTRTGTLETLPGEWDEDVPVCGLVLAGGEGRRLQPFIRSLGKKTLPKQYVNFIGRRSMLEHTLHRAERLIPRPRVFTVVNQNHLKHPEVREQLANRPQETIVVQPENKETATGILFALTYLDKRCPNSTVLVLPSDHFVAEEDRLMSYARLAIDMVRRDPAKLVLLGLQPETEEPEYGYILTGKRIMRGAPDAAEISWFIEKPDLHTAKRLALNGGLWNTMIMAFQIGTLFHWVSRLAPEIHSQFLRIREAIDSDQEASVVEKVYRKLKPVNFSKELLEPMVTKYPSSLIAFPVRNVLWSDWGTAERVIAILRKTGYLSHFNGRKGKGAKNIDEYWRSPELCSGRGWEVTNRIVPQS